MPATQVILLERVESLGQMGDVVSVKPGFARNYLLPQKKALRASKENIAFFEAQKKHLQADNDKRKKDAEKVAKKIEGLKVPLIRQASEGGQLFGSVNARDIAAALSEVSGETITKTMVYLNQNIKMIGFLVIDINLHPEVKAQITINIARTPEEAKIQAETGRVLIASDSDAKEDKRASKKEAPVVAEAETVEVAAEEADAE
jgi:large subunit ribosomal protein L9